MRFSEATVQMVEAGYTPNITQDPDAVLRGRGFNPITKRLSALQEARLDQTFDVWGDFKSGRLNPLLMLEAFNPGDSDLYSALNRRYPMVFHESIGTADFGFLTDNMVNRLLMAAESPLPTTWRQIAKINDQVKDFRTLNRYSVDGGFGVFEKVGAREGFNRRTVQEGLKTYSVAKYEHGVDLDWESVINDDLSALTDMPTRLLIGGDMTVEKFTTELYVDANGPHASFFTAGNGNILAGNPALSQAALEAAVAHFLDYEDVDGIPITATGAILVVSTGDMLVKATNWKNTLMTEITTSAAMGDANRKAQVRNWLAEKFSIIYNPWVNKVAVTANGATSWFIFATPGVNRPAIELGFLRGFTKPTLYRKRSDTVAAGGGEVASMGDFETMATSYKGLVVFGGTTIYPKAALSSNGSGV